MHPRCWQSASRTPQARFIFACPLSSRRKSLSSPFPLMACHLPHVSAHFGHENYRDFCWEEVGEVQSGKGGKGGYAIDIQHHDPKPNFQARRGVRHLSQSQRGARRKDQPEGFEKGMRCWLTTIMRLPTCQQGSSCPSTVAHTSKRFELLSTSGCMKTGSCVSVSVCLSVCLSICLSVCLSVRAPLGHLSVHVIDIIYHRVIFMYMYTQYASLLVWTLCFNPRFAPFVQPALSAKATWSTKD